MMSSMPCKYLAEFSQMNQNHPNDRDTFVGATAASRLWNCLKRYTQVWIFIVGHWRTIPTRKMISTFEIWIAELFRIQCLSVFWDGWIFSSVEQTIILRFPTTFPGEGSIWMVFHGFSSS